MKKGVYSVKVVVDESSCVQQASCECPAGVDGRCNHLAATLFMLESLDGNENKENSKSHEQSPNIPCTSKPCTWNVPKRAEKALPIQEMKFVKHGWGKKIHQPKNLVNLCQQRPTQADLHSFYHKSEEARSCDWYDDRIKLYSTSEHFHK